MFTFRKKTSDLLMLNENSAFNFGTAPGFAVWVLLVRTFGTYAEGLLLREKIALSIFLLLVIFQSDLLLDRNKVVSILVPLTKEWQNLSLLISISFTPSPFLALFQSLPFSLNLFQCLFYSLSWSYFLSLSSSITNTHAIIIFLYVSFSHSLSQ